MDRRIPVLVGSGTHSRENRRRARAKAGEDGKEMVPSRPNDVGQELPCLTQNKRMQIHSRLSLNKYKFCLIMQ